MKTGIVTGSSRGIGLSTVKLLTEDANTRVVGSSTSGEHPMQTSNFKCIALDLSNSQSIIEFIDQVKENNINFLINNAAVLLESWDVSEINHEQLKQTFEVNLFGTIELTERLLPYFKSGSHIINITSDWGSFSEKNFDAYQPHYKMSKTALNMYTKLLAKRLEERQIIVSSLDPGWTQTDMGGAEASRLPEDVAIDIIDLLNSNAQTGKFWHRGKNRNW